MATKKNTKKVSTVKATAKPAVKKVATSKTKPVETKKVAPKTEVKKVEVKKPVTPVEVKPEVKKVEAKPNNNSSVVINKPVKTNTNYVSKKGFIAGLTAAIVLIGGLGGAAGYFGYKYLSTKNNTGDVIVDPISKQDAEISKFDTVDGGDKVGTVTSTTKTITDVKVSIGSTLLSSDEYSANQINFNGLSKWEVRIKKATLNKYKGTIVVTPVFDNATKSFKVSFKDGTTTIASEQTVIENNCAVQPHCEKSGYTLVGWFKNPELTDKFDFSTPIVADLVLYSKWEAVTPTEKFSVTFNSNGGSFVETQLVEKNGHATRKTSTREDYSLLGWFIDGQEEAFNFETTPITSNIVLNAKWKLKEATTENGLTFIENEYEEGTCSVFVDTKDSEAVRKLPSRFAIPSEVEIDGKLCKVTRLNNIKNGGLRFTENLHQNLNVNSKSYEKGAFSELKNIVEVEIPDTVTYIDEYAFAGCSSLRKIKIPSHCIEIGAYTFSECSGLQEVEFNDELKIINRGAFKDCASLKNIVIPSSVKTIEDNCFEGCERVTKVTFGSESAISYLGNYAFYNCGSLSTINIPSSILSINENVFYQDESLTNEGLIFDDDISPWYNKFDQKIESKYIVGKLVSGDPIYKGAIEGYNDWALLRTDNKNKNCSVYYMGDFTKDIVVPDKINDYTVTGIGDYCFERSTGCSVELKSITLPSTINTIGECAFESFSSFDAEGNPTFFDVKFSNNKAPETLSIGKSAFNNCNIKSFNDKNGEAIIIPEGVERLGDNIFTNCEYIESVKLPSSLKEISYGEAVSDGRGFIMDENNSTYPFYGCSKLNKIDVDENNEYFNSDAYGFYESTTNTLYHAIVSTPEEENPYKYTVKEGTKSIGKFAFTSCEFIDSYGLELTLAKSLIDIDENTSSYLTKVELNGNENFKFDNEKIGFYSIDSNKKLTLLRAFTTSETTQEKFTLLEDTIKIGKKPFRDNKFKTIVLNEGLETIDEYAFTNIKSLNELTIPSSVNSIGNGAFDNCIITKTIIESQDIADLKYNVSNVFQDEVEISVAIRSKLSKNSYILSSGFYEEGDVTEEGTIIFKIK